VQINVYCVPILGEPEFGISTKIGASFDGVDGQYCVGMGIDQEAAIFISQERNGQPKFPCDIRFYRLGDYVEAKARHQGYTFFEFTGRSTGPVPPADGDQVLDEWWIKASRAIGGVEKEWDFPPHVVRVHSLSEQVHVEELDGDLILRDSPWDPYTELLPMREQLSARLVTSAHKERSVTNAGPLDPDAFWPHADTIGGSRWPGQNGGPRGWRPHL
jgi:acetoacetate decarboxylase